MNDPDDGTGHTSSGSLSVKRLIASSPRSANEAPQAQISLLQGGEVNSSSILELSAGVQLSSDSYQIDSPARSRVRLRMGMSWRNGGLTRW